MRALLALCSLVFAVPEASARVGDTRTVKVDLFSFGQALHPYGSDWQPSVLDIWSVVLDCEEVRFRVEHCEAKGDQLLYGVVPAGEQTAVFKRIPMAGTIELQWTPSGRLKHYDVQGDREPFWEAGSNALLELYHKNAVFKPDSVRRVGKDLELALTRGIASALEIDRPDPSQASWKTKAPLWAGRRYSSAAGIGRTKWTAASVDDGTKLTWTGTVGESSSSGSTAKFGVKTEVVGEAIVDDQGELVRLFTESHSTSTSVNLVGHTRWMALSSRWEEGDSTDPADMPPNRLP
jgi:hypothetical protein